MLPVYSSRWRDTFLYGQVKTEMSLGNSPIRPYLSMRMIADTRGRVEHAALGPQYLSENSAILGVGLATQQWRRIVAWGEAGQSFSFRGDTAGSSRPDFRGGVSYARIWGRGLGSEAPGFFYETNADGVFVSRFDNTLLGYSQNRGGYTLPGLGRLRTQVLWNGNLTVDAKRQPWANIVELGPGVRLRFDGMPPALTFSVNAVRGRYLIKANNPYPLNFTDIRAGVWYAFVR
jgi:hypothetical protein